MVTSIFISCTITTVGNTFIKLAYAQNLSNSVPVLPSVPQYPHAGELNSAYASAASGNLFMLSSNVMLAGDNISRSPFNNVIPGSYIVTIYPNETATPNNLTSVNAAATQLIENLGKVHYTLVGNFSAFDNPSFAVAAEPGQALNATASALAINMFSSTPGVHWSPDQKVVASDSHVDTVFSAQAAQTGQYIPREITRVGADLSYANVGSGSNKDINGIVAVLDSGIDLKHRDLHVCWQKTFLPNTSTANDGSGHGTHVAGIIGARDNNFGTVGIAPGVCLIAMKVLNDDPEPQGNLIGINLAIDQLVALKKTHTVNTDVINLSLTVPGQDNQLENAIASAARQNITIVAAAGNDQKDASNYEPARLGNGTAESGYLITVAAMTDTDGKCGGLGPLLVQRYGPDDSFAAYSNFGKVITLLAPGSLILSTFPPNNIAYMSGTSQATPAVAGAAVLYKAIHPGATPNEIRTSLLRSGSMPSTTCDGKGHGYLTNPFAPSEPMLYIGNMR